jgi:type IV secretion system protein VirB10
MSDGHQLLGAPHIMRGKPGADQHAEIRRLNRLPVFLALGVILLVIAAVIFGLSACGLWRNGAPGEAIDDRGPASSFADNLKRGVSDGIIGENPPVEMRPPAMEEPQVIAAPRPEPTANPRPVSQPASNSPRRLEEDENLWRERLKREHEEQMLNERHRQAMARMQRADGARASPLRIDTSTAAALSSNPALGHGADRRSRASAGDGLDARIIAAADAIGAQGSGLSDPNGQGQKQAFLDAGKSRGAAGAGIKERGSPLTLSRGSVIPAMLLTGINADLPGRILAQVSQNVYDSATGRHLLIPQGSRLVGRYDSKVSHGQSRILVVWTDIVLANGQSLDIGSMAGIDQEGQAGFRDRIDRHLLRTFGTAALVALIGTGMDLALPDNRSFGESNASDAARRSFSETFGRLAERTISKNLDVQPTLSIRPGYRFNILVDQDLVFG